MASLTPNEPSSTYSALFLALTAIAGTGYLVRVLHRRERVAARRRADDFAVTLREFLARRIPARAMAGQAADAHPDVFWSALEDLTTRGDGWLLLSRTLAGCPHLETERLALRSESPWRRELAARRLGLLFSPKSRTALRAALEPGPELVTAAALGSLARYRDHEALAWALAHPEALARRPHHGRVTMLRAFGRRALPDMAAALDRGTGSAAMDRALIDALGLSDHRDGRFAIERRLRSKDLELRVAAARALGRLEAGDCATALLGALQDPEWQVRAQAAWALGRMRAPIALLALPGRLTDPAWWVRRHAAHALRAFGDEGRRELERIAHGSPDPYARDMAGEVLETWNQAA